MADDNSNGGNPPNKEELKLQEKILTALQGQSSAKQKIEDLTKKIAEHDERTAKSVGEKTAALEREQANLTSLNQSYDYRALKLQEELDVMEDKTRLYAAQIERASELDGVIEAVWVQTTKLRDEQNELYALGLKIDGEGVKRLGAIKEQLALKESELASLEEEEKKLKHINESSEEHLQQLELEVKLKRQSNQASDRLASGTESLLQTFTGITDQSHTFFGSLMAAENGLADIGAKMSDILTVQNIAGSTIQKVTEMTLYMAKATDEAQSSVASATGTGREYADVLNTSYEANAQFAMSIGDSAEILGTMHNGLTDFSHLSDQAQGELMNFASGMSKLGVSAETSAASLEVATRVLGMTAAEARESQESLARTALAMGVAPAKMAMDFQNMAPKLVHYGESTERVFKDLAIQSKATGLAMEELLGITQQFDTFSGAADAAGKLNALLGGPFLDTMAMLGAEENDRLLMLQDAFKSSGQQWEAMGRKQKQAIASSMNMSVEAAAKLFSANARTYGSMKELMDENAVSSEELTARQEAVATIGEKMMRIFESFALAAAPLVDVVGTAVEYLLTLMTKFHGGTIMGVTAIAVMGAKMISWGASAVGIFKKVTTAAATYAGVAKAGAEATEAMESGGKGKGGGVAGMMDKMSKIDAKSIAALGVAFMFVGAGIALAALGMSALVESFAVLKDNSEAMNSALLAIGLVMGGMVAMMGAFGAVLYFMTPAAYAAAPAIFALGVSFFLIGAGIAVAALGMAQMVKEISNMGESAGQILSLAGALMTLVAAMSMVALTGAWGAVGFLGLALAFKGLSSALNDMPGEVQMTSLSNLVTTMASENAAKNIPTTTEALEGGMKTITNTFQESNIDDKTIERMTTFTNNVAAFQKAQAEMKSPSDDALAKILDKLVKLQTGGAPKTARAGGSSRQSSSSIPSKLEANIYIGKEKLETQIVRVLERGKPTKTSTG